MILIVSKNIEADSVMIVWTWTDMLFGSPRETYAWLLEIIYCDTEGHTNYIPRNISKVKS